MGDNSAQSIGFVGKDPDEEKQKKVVEKPIMDLKTQLLFAESSKNYNNMVNNMLYECSKVCFKNLKTSELTIGEKDCLSICQQKYYFSYFLSEKFANSVSSQIENQKLDENNKLTTVLEKARKTTSANL